MDLTIVIFLVVGVLATWVLCGLVVAVILGRVSSAAEHERQVAALRREMRQPDQADTGAKAPDLVLST